ncbi:MAG TPA: hypothetical protein VMK65_11785 [Longimicrobiales bacterium]|nr:hypothetical protein [Longimicrobiales bacterium]
MKKPDGLGEVVQTWRAGAAQEEAAIVAELQAEAGPAVAAAETALPVYAEMARQHGARLRAEQTWLKDPVLGRSRWFLDVATARERGAEILMLLEGNPPLIAKHLDEVARMTAAAARSHRLERVLIPALLGMADTADQLAEQVTGYDEGVAMLKRRLQAEAPDLAPRPTLASAGGDEPPSSPRRAKSGLSGAGDD